MDDDADGEPRPREAVQPWGDGGLPWYVKVALAVVLLGMLFVVGIDLLEFAT
jgi:hypothetical protein